MNVLMLSTDVSILEHGSESHGRMKDYGTLAERLDIIVCTVGVPKQELVISENTRAIPTNSRTKLWYVRDMARIAKKYAIGTAYSLVTSQDPFETGLAGWFISRRLKAKLQLQIHTDFLSPYFRRSSFKNKIRVILAKWLLPKADSIRVVSERIKKSLIGLGLSEKKIIVLPIFVDVEKIQSRPTAVDLHKKHPQFDFIILMASRLTREKNILLAINAMSETVKSHPKAGLVIVGDGPEKERLQRTIHDSRLTACVLFEPRTPHLTMYYKTADVFLNTSNYEGYGRTLIEAAAAGLPIITTNVGVVGEVFNKGNCVIVPIGNQTWLAQALINVATSGDFRKQLSERARVAVRKLPNKEQLLTLQKHLWQNL